MAYVILVIETQGLTFFSDHVVTPLLRVVSPMSTYMQGHADEIDKGLSTGLSYVCGKIKEALNKAIDYVPYLIHSAAKVRKWIRMNSSLMLRKQIVLFVYYLRFDSG